MKAIHRGFKLSIYILPVIPRVFVISFLFILVTFHILFIFSIQNLAAFETETPSVENKDPETIGVEIFTNDLGMTFVAISPGRYLMGSPSHELGRLSIFEKQHEVTIEKQFYMQTTEVTQRQWKKIMGNNPSFFFNCGEDCPVESVSWFDAQIFIRELNRNSTANRYRLPTEAEWEFACRAGSTKAFSNSDLERFECHENNGLNEIAWYKCNSDKTTHPAKRKMPNKIGLYDMHGNVYEWCKDTFVMDYSVRSNLQGNQLDVTEDKVVRGGSWNATPVSCRSGSRVNYKPERKDRTIGFRLVRESKYYKIEESPSIEIKKEVPEKNKPKTASAPPDDKSTPQIVVRGPDSFAVQVASTKSLDYAEHQVARYIELGYNAYHIKVKIAKIGTWHRICLGNFETMSDAELFRKELARKNIHGIILNK